MRKFLTGIVGAAILGTSMLAATAPADAQRWGGHGGYRGGGGFHGGYGGYRGGYGGYGGGWHRHGGVGAGTAIAAGVLGLGVGAALASDRGYYGGGYGGGYYAYAPPPPPPVYYAPVPAYGYGYYGGYGW